jgi:hypothetical protein
MAVTDQRGLAVVSVLLCLVCFVVVVFLFVYFSAGEPGWSPARFSNGPRQRVVCISMHFWR